jgi:Ca2+-binding RTX toxin-like protein
MAAILVVASGLVALAASAPVALGATAQTLVTAQKRWVVYTAAPGEHNRLTLKVSISNRNVLFADAGATITPGPGCAAEIGGTVECGIVQGIGLVRVDLGDESDRADATTQTPGSAQVNIAGRSGDDVIQAHGPTRFELSGGAGDDWLSGGQGPDVLDGGPGHDTLIGRWGSDVLLGDSGPDLLLAGPGDGADRLYGGSGNDHLDARTGFPTPARVVSCGRGYDVANVDSSDFPAISGCEKLTGPWAPL